MFTQVVELRLRGGPTGGYDDLGAPEYEPDTIELWPAWYEGMSSEEQTDARDRQEWGYTLFLPTETPELTRALIALNLAPAPEAVEEALRRLERPLRSYDSVVIEQTEYKVVGEPSVQPGGYIVPGYSKTVVRRETG